MDERAKLPPLEVRERCREILIEEAERHEIEPAMVVAHVRYVSANHARREVQRRMYDELGLKRHVIATMFGRDLRRVRASVLSVSSSIRVFRPKVRVVPVGEQFVWGFGAPKPPRRKTGRPITKGKRNRGELPRFRQLEFWGLF